MNDTKLTVEYMDIAALKPYERNARKHEPKDIAAIRKSIEDFGFNDPIGIWHDIIVEGHGRLLAAKDLGMQTVPVIRLDHLDDEGRRAYAIAHNKTAENSEWDMPVLESELRELEKYFDMTDFGFDAPADGSEWFDRKERNDTSRQEGNDKYNAFLDKFENPKTTDDCYTPDNIYAAVEGWVRKEYGLEDVQFVRPFYPNGDYQKHKYPSGSVVVDNPPFSILAQIVDFYTERDIKFFLFAPALAIMTYCNRKGVVAVCTQNGVTYENGASVPTSFLTNLGDGTIVAFSAPDLYAAIDAANEINEKAQHKSLPKYEYPDEVITSAKLGWLGKYGQRLAIKRTEALMIRQLDAMKESGQTIYGNGLLLAEGAAAERAAAERAAAEGAAAEGAAALKALKWKLSEREQQIVRTLGKGVELSNG